MAINHDRGRSFLTEVKHYKLTLCKYDHYVLTNLLRRLICGLFCTNYKMVDLTVDKIHIEGGRRRTQREGSWQVSLVLWLDWSCRAPTRETDLIKGQGEGLQLHQYQQVGAKVDIQMRVDWPSGDVLPSESVWFSSLCLPLAQNILKGQKITKPNYFPSIIVPCPGWRTV